MLLRNADIDTSDLAVKDDFIALKVGIEKLSINRLKALCNY